MPKVKEFISGRAVIFIKLFSFTLLYIYFYHCKAEKQRHPLPFFAVSRRKRILFCSRTSQVALVVKNPPANAGDIRDTGLIRGLGRSSGEGNGNPLQCSCLENPLDRGAWRATVHKVTESDTTEMT